MLNKNIWKKNCIFYLFNEFFRLWYTVRCFVPCKNEQIIKEREKKTSENATSEDYKPHILQL